MYNLYLNSKKINNRAKLSDGRANALPCPPLAMPMVLKYQHEQKCLVSITSWFTQHICMYIRSVYRESPTPRHYLSIEIKDHKFWKFKTYLYNHHSSKPEHITVCVLRHLKPELA